MMRYQDEWWRHQRVADGRECAQRWELIKDHIHQHGTLVDIEANLGYYSLRAADDFPALHAITVESDRRSAAKQRAIVRSWDHDRVDVVVGALTAERAKAVRESGERIDTLLLLSVLHRLDDPAAVMSEMAKCARRIIVELDDDEADGASAADASSPWAHDQQLWLESVTSGAVTLLGHAVGQTQGCRSRLWRIDTTAAPSPPACTPKRFGDLMPRTMWWDEQRRQVEQWGGVSASQFNEVQQRWSDVALLLGAIDAGPLGPLTNGNVVRRVVLANHQEAVLKVPVVAPGDEAGTLAAWTDLDCVVKLLAAGPNNSWLLTGFEEGSAPTNTLSIDMLRQATQLSSALHVPAPRDFHDVTAQTCAALRADRDTLAREGHSVSQQLLDTLIAGMHAEEQVVVHGDFRSRNTLLRRRDGKLVALDPSGGQGPNEVDMAHWVAIESALSGADPYESLRFVCSVDARLDRHRLNCWCAASLLGVARGELHTRFAAVSVQQLLSWVETLGGSRPDGHA